MCPQRSVAIKFATDRLCRCWWESYPFYAYDEAILISYDVTTLFTNVPLDETINILVNKAFTDDWFTKTDGFTVQEDQLAELLKTATTNQLFSFNGELYEQTNGVAMGSPPGPLMANVFTCHLEEELTHDGLIPHLYTRYVDDTMTSAATAVVFLTTLNNLHSSLTFTMELPVGN